MMQARSNNALFEFLLRLGDDKLILGHRLSEWCGHAPLLEEDVALSNIALDCIGQASMLLSLAAEVEGKGRTEDDLTYFREETEFRNLKLVELPNYDFAYTMAKQFLYNCYSLLLYERLQKTSFEKLIGIAAKSYKEIKYHYRHSSQWILRLGDGTVESHNRIQNAFDNIWMYTGEMFIKDEIDEIMIAEGISPDISSLKTLWQDLVYNIFKEATLTIPDENQYMQKGSRNGFHTEHLGHLLSEMQIVARSYPGVKW